MSADDWTLDRRDADLHWVEAAFAEAELRIATTEADRSDAMRRVVEHQRCAELLRLTANLIEARENAKVYIAAAQQALDRMTT